MAKHEEALYALRGANLTVKSEVLRNINERHVLSLPEFYISPGGSEHHHNYRHGLVIHVNEVMRNVLYMTNDNPSDELITAVLWHDLMKTRDYFLKLDVQVTKLPYRKLINHVAGSAMEFHKLCSAFLPKEQLEYIEHLLLSHHGRKEWGSPVEPATAEAFILHAADMMSSRGVNL